MINPEAMDQVAACVAKLNGIDLETALDAVWVVGDCMEMDEDGEHVLARVGLGKYRTPNKE